MSIAAMTWAWAQKIEARDKLVLMALADHADDDGICWPGIKGVAEKNRISERAVQRHLASLQAAGIVIVLPQYRSDGSRTTNLYRLQLSHVSPPSATLPPPSDTPDQVNLASPPGELGVTDQVNLASPPGELGVTDQVTRASPLESPSESPRNHHSPLIGEIDETVNPNPDWYKTLKSIPGFVRAFEEAEAWRIAKNISEELAESTAYALKGKWTTNRWTDPWATFQHWVKMSQLNGGRDGESRRYPEERYVSKVYEPRVDAAGEPLLGH